MNATPHHWVPLVMPGDSQATRSRWVLAILRQVAADLEGYAPGTTLTVDKRSYRGTGQVDYLLSVHRPNAAGVVLAYDATGSNIMYGLDAMGLARYNLRADMVARSLAPLFAVVPQSRESRETVGYLGHAARSAGAMLDELDWVEPGVRIARGI